MVKPLVYMQHDTRENRTLHVEEKHTPKCNMILIVQTATDAIKSGSPRTTKNS